MDRVQLRKDVSTYAKAGSWDLARAKLGQLIYYVVQDFIPFDEKDNWKKTRCVPHSARLDTDKVIGIEFTKLVYRHL